MSDPATEAQRQGHAQQGLVVSLITLPFRLFGVLCGSLLLSIVIECVGMHWWWPEQGWRHAQHMLRYELEQLGEQFPRSAVVQEPGAAARRVVDQAYAFLFEQSGLRRAVEEASARPVLDHARRDDALLDHLTDARASLHGYLMAALYTVLVFLARLVTLCLTIPLMCLALFVGLVDGLVQRDVRKFGAGRESGFLFHRAKSLLASLAVMPWVVYLILPISLHPLWVILPCTAALAVTMQITAASFKKYL